MRTNQEHHQRIQNIAIHLEIKSESRNCRNTHHGSEPGREWAVIPFAKEKGHAVFLQALENGAKMFICQFFYFLVIYVLHMKNRRKIGRKEGRKE